VPEQHRSSSSLRTVTVTAATIFGLILIGFILIVTVLTDIVLDFIIAFIFQSLFLNGLCSLRKKLSISNPLFSPTSHCSCLGLILDDHPFVWLAKRSLLLSLSEFTCW
jgi:hypothetical protein